jgi:DNA (cytosine-5)-methyltransferase 1
VLFSGAGGETCGIILVPGNRVTTALNHSEIALATHRLNHPATFHDCVNVSQADPRWYPRTEALWASPECTHFTRARGKRRVYGEFGDGVHASDGTQEVAIRSRATMYDVARFAEAMRPQVIVVENVVDCFWWGPEHAQGAAFTTWIQSIRLWGYQHRVLFLDGVHATALGPGSRSRRSRMFVVFWLSSGRAPDFDKWLRPYATCPVHGRVQLVQEFKTTKTCSPDRPWGVYGPRWGQYYYRCPKTSHGRADAIIEPAVRTAADAIDWTLPHPVLVDRATPLVTSTIAKLQDGWHRHQQRTTTGPRLPHRRVNDFELLPYYGNSRKTVPVDRPAPTITTIDTVGLVGYGTSFEESRYRMWTVCENARALEFPDSYQFVGDHDQCNLQIGNAVTPPASRDLAALVSEVVTGTDMDRLTLAA